MVDLSIGHNFFNEKFKDYLRNFYVYGDIPESEFPGSARTYRNDALRFERIGFIPLTEDGQDPRWRMEGKTKCLQMVTGDSRELHRNPVHVFYTLCESTETDAVFFLMVLLRAAMKREQKEELFIDDIMAWTDPQWRRQWEALCRETTDPEKAAREKKRFRDRTQANIRKRLQQEFGNPGLLNWEVRGNNNLWTLPELTLEALLGSVPEEDRWNFLTAVDFFMKLGPFGEIGDRILSRLPEKDRRAVEKNSIRMDQFYLSKSLNDYNSVDLLQAIDSGSWSIITYYQPQEQIEGYILCKPMKLRTSAVNGREYVGYYDPVRRRACYLRLEYIQSVELLDGRYVSWLLAALWGAECRVLFRDRKEFTVCRPAVFAVGDDGSVGLAKYVGSGYRAQATLCCLDEQGGKRTVCGTDLVDSRLPDPSVVQEELDRATCVLDRAWGVSIPYGTREQTMMDLPLHTVTMTLYVWPGEEFIRTRLRREARRGICEDLDERHIRFTAQVLDPWEMIPWISSFAGRICRVTSTEPEFENHLRLRLRQMYRANIGPVPEDLPELSPARPRDLWYRIPNLIRDTRNPAYQGQLRNPSPLCQKKAQDHELLFSPLYSRTYHNCLTAFDRISAGAGAADRRLPWRQARKDAVEVSVLDQQMLDTLTTRSRQGSVARFEQMLPRIAGVCEAASALKDVTPLMMKLVPLTGLEQRWLLAVLREPLAGYFLGQQAVDRLSTVLNTSGDRQPLFSQEIEAFDQYRHQAHERPGSRRHFHLLRTAVKAGRSVHVTYRSPGRREPWELDVFPARMDYAIRDDVFRISGQRLDTADPVTLRLDRIMEVELLPGSGGKPPTGKPSGSQEEYTLVFDGEKNLPDRVLTQFAPRQKRCVRSGDGTYRLTFQAGENEWTDILAQVLSFGSGLRLQTPDRGVREIRHRLERQKHMWM